MMRPSRTTTAPTGISPSSKAKRASVSAAVIQRSSMLVMLTPSLEVHLSGFEPETFGSVDRCSIQLSYRCVPFESHVSFYADMPFVGEAHYAQKLVKCKHFFSFLRFL